MNVSTRGRSVRLAVAGAGILPAALLLSYAASPYVALFKLGQALQSHDVKRLEAAVDWTSVRDGIKQEIDASLAGDPSPAATISPRTVMATTIVKRAAPAADEDLPDFGSSFATTAISSSVDADCTAEHLASMLGGDATDASQPKQSMFARARHAIRYAFFSGPRHFTALINPGDPAAAPVKVSMTFSARKGWRVDHVWLPPEMLDPGKGERT